MLHLEDGPSRRRVPALPCAAVPGLGQEESNPQRLHPGDPS